MRQLVLASASPRRRDLLEKSGYKNFLCVSPDVRETSEFSAQHYDLVTDNAVMKAENVAARYPDAVVLAADTVILFQGEIIGKPADLNDAIRILMRLSGKTHHVVTDVCIRCVQTSLCQCLSFRSEVTFLPFDRKTAEQYVSLVDVLDKAGAYAVQEHGELIIQKCSGSLNNVIGLPVELLTSKIDMALNES